MKNLCLALQNQNHYLPKLRAKNFFNLLILIILIYFFKHMIINKSINFDSTTKLKRKFFKNYEWMPNNKVLQYSSYLIVDKRKIELKLISIIAIDVERIGFIDSSYKCIFKSILKGFIFEKPVTHKITLHHQKSLKIYCSFNKGSLPIKLEDISVAIVKVGDYKKFNFGWSSKENELPYEMINYQIPKLISTPEKKIKNVCICVNFVHTLPSMIPEWVELHKKLNVAQMVLYESTENDSLIKLINNYNFNNIVEVRPYSLNEIETCDMTSFEDFVNKTEGQFYNKTCFEFVSRLKFKLPVWDSRSPHEDMSSNDCYITESEKYEFVAIYDVDEIVLPKSFEHVQDKTFLSCYRNNEICSDQSLFPYSLYYYCLEIIKKYSKIPLKNVANLKFNPSIYLEKDENIPKFIKDIKNLLLSNNLSFPINLSLLHGSNEKRSFRILNKDDLEYVKSLVNDYDIFECLYDKYKDKLVKTYPNFSRFIYLATETVWGKMHPYKKIHYTDNVRAIYTHDAIDFTNKYNSKNEIIADITAGHMLSHFRSYTSGILSNNIEGSINRFKIDKAYLRFLIKNSTNFCEKMT